MERSFDHSAKFVSLTPCSRFVPFVTYSGCKFASKTFSIFPPHFPPPLTPPSNASPSSLLSSTPSPSPQHADNHFILPCYLIPRYRLLSTLLPSAPAHTLTFPLDAPYEVAAVRHPYALKSSVKTFSRSNPSWFASPYHVLMHTCSHFYPADITPGHSQRPPSSPLASETTASLPLHRFLAFVGSFAMPLPYHGPLSYASCSRGVH